jgi:hypothetical protein
VQSNEQSTEAEPWLNELRQELIDAGYDQSQVDQTIGSALQRFRSSRVHDFIPLLVERAVHRELPIQHERIRE